MSTRPAGKECEQTTKRKPRKLGVCLVCTLLSRSLLVRDKLVAVKALLIVGQHDGDAVAKGQVLPGDVEALPALATPGRADARPDFLAGRVFADSLPVVEDVGWCVGHTHVVINTAFTARDYKDVSMLCYKPQTSEILQGPAGRFQHAAQSPARECVTTMVVVDHGDAAIRVAIDAATGTGLPFQQKPVTP